MTECEVLRAKLDAAKRTLECIYFRKDDTYNKPVDLLRFCIRDAKARLDQLENEEEWNERV